MFSPDTLAVFKRLLILAVLSIGLVVFSSSVGDKTVYAAACLQDCMTSENYCYDSCLEFCDGDDDEACNSCLSVCVSEFNSCARHSVWCEGAEVSYTPTCQGSFVHHCPIINGAPDCSHPEAHWSYTLDCQTIGGGHCLWCQHNPDYWDCGGGPYC